MAVILFYKLIYFDIINKECVVTNFVYLLAYILSCKRGLARSLKSFYAFE